jgi:catechol 2,3-dioxygenase-like lactoylglutathione lyase family enzyme
MRRRTLVSTVAPFLAGLALLALAGPSTAADNPAAQSHANARISAFGIAGDKTEHVFYTNGTGSVIELFTRLGDNTGWHQNDLTAETSAPRAASGPDAYYWKSTGTSHVIYRGTDGGIHELYRGANGKWALNNLTQKAGLPKAAGEPAGFVDEGSKTEHVVFRTTDGNLIELSSKYGAAGGWQSLDLTKMANAPRAAGSPDAFYWPSTRTEHVLYRGSDDNVHELFLANNGSWQHNDLTAAARAPKAAGDPNAFVEHKNNTEHVCYRTEQGDIIQLSTRFKTTEGWRAEDLTKTTRAPKAAGDPSGYRLSEGGLPGAITDHVVYRDVDGNIQELFIGGPENRWALNNLSKDTNAPKAASDPTGYVFTPNKTQHVVFETAEGQIYELYNVPAGNNRGWHGNPLKATTTRTP